jgi:hypothetical protein
LDVLKGVMLLPLLVETTVLGRGIYVAWDVTGGVAGARLWLDPAPLDFFSDFPVVVRFDPVSSPVAAVPFRFPSRCVLGNCDLELED